MIDTTAIFLNDNNPDTIPTYNQDFMQQIASISADQVGGNFDANITAAIKSFEKDTLLKVFPHTYVYEFKAAMLYNNPRRTILVPGLNCNVTDFELDETPVDPSSYKTRIHPNTGSAFLIPKTYWNTTSYDSEYKITFTAGTPTLSADITECIATLMKYNEYGEMGDLVKYNLTKNRLSIGTIIYK